jgi:hypothetical protein
VPPKRETDPAILEQRKRRQRERTARRMRVHRAKAKNIVTTLLGNALATVTDRPNMPTSGLQALASRTAQAVLKNTLLRHGVTQDRVVRTVSEGLDSMRQVKRGDEISSLPDTQHRLRASDTALKLLERAGEVPGLRHSEPAAHIHVNIVQFGGDSQRTIDVEAVRAETGDTDSESAGE